MQTDKQATDTNVGSKQMTNWRDEYFNLYKKGRENKAPSGCIDYYKARYFIQQTIDKAVAAKHKQIKDLLLGMQRIHKHNSIPCLVDEDELGCVICVRNKTIKEMLGKLKL